MPIRGTKSVKTTVNADILYRRSNAIPLFLSCLSLWLSCVIAKCITSATFQWPQKNHGSCYYNSNNCFMAIIQVNLNLCYQAPQQRILLKQSLTLRMPLLMATTASGLGWNRASFSQWCYNYTIFVPQSYYYNYIIKIHARKGTR